jgi:hypothetical protein
MSNTASNTPVVLALLLGLAVPGVAASARAQSSDAGPSPDSTGHTTAATDPNAEAAAQAPSAAEPAPNNSGFPKTLSPQQRLPENLQGWMRERNRRQPAIVQRPLAVPDNLAPQLPESSAEQQQAADRAKRRLRSFDEHGVTVLSNRHAPAPAPEPVAATAAVAVAAAVPAPRVEDDPDPEVPPMTETRSLRAKQKAQAPLSDGGLGWPAFAVPIAAIGLGLLWLRRRRQTEQSR